MKTIIFLFLFSFSTISSVQAMTGNEWLKACDTMESLRQAYLNGLTDMEMGMLAAFNVINKHLKKKYPDESKVLHHELRNQHRVMSFCVPKMVLRSQIRKIVIKWLDENPTRLHELMMVTYTVAMRESFPCDWKNQ
jgi:hypothetical protein